ncbi:uncharacterized protein LOC117201816 [Orcinus orca]|uniref:uncharacterized protein LOC117201816 n=1 Tax=Orcinus orca TaxID=9733 RepID=UPI0021130323|nr:uncharacterized protein LOC117201816 [Orcinus orca]
MPTASPRVTSGPGRHNPLATPPCRQDPRNALPQRCSGGPAPRCGLSPSRWTPATAHTGTHTATPPLAPRQVWPLAHVLTLAQVALCPDCPPAHPGSPPPPPLLPKAWASSPPPSSSLCPGPPAVGQAGRQRLPAERSGSWDQGVPLPTEAAMPARAPEGATKGGPAALPHSPIRMNPRLAALPGEITHSSATLRRWHQEEFGSIQSR